MKRPSDYFTFNLTLGESKIGLESNYRQKKGEVKINDHREPYRSTKGW